MKRHWEPVDDVEMEGVEDEALAALCRESAFPLLPRNFLVLSEERAILVAPRKGNKEGAREGGSSHAYETAIR